MTPQAKSLIIRIGKRVITIGLFAFLSVFALTKSQASTPKKTEAELIAMLASDEFSDVNDALDRLPNWYPNSTNAVIAIREILRTKETMFRREDLKKDKNSNPVRRQIVVSRSEVGLPAGLLARRAARSLGNYHAVLPPDELGIIYEFLRSRDVEVTQDGLKSLAGLRDTNAVPLVIPLLYDKDVHVSRDACKTLGTIGNESHIALLEPFTHDLRWDIKIDARNAIAAIKSRN